VSRLSASVPFNDDGSGAKHLLLKLWIFNEFSAGRFQQMGNTRCLTGAIVFGHFLYAFFSN
jgi:hypothetical protein